MSVLFSGNLSVKLKHLKLDSVKLNRHEKIKIYRVSNRIHIEMAVVRNLNVKTIVNHLESISINYGVELIEYLRPTKEVLTQVAGAMHLTKGVKRSDIF